MVAMQAVYHHSIVISVHCSIADSVPEYIFLLCTCFQHCGLESIQNDHDLLFIKENGEKEGDDDPRNVDDGGEQLG